MLFTLINKCSSPNSVIPELRWPLKRCWTTKKFEWSNFSKYFSKKTKCTKNESLHSNWSRSTPSCGLYSWPQLGLVLHQALPLLSFTSGKQLIFHCKTYHFSWSVGTSINNFILNILNPIIHMLFLIITQNIS